MTHEIERGQEVEGDYLDDAGAIEPEQLPDVEVGGAPLPADVVDGQGG